MENTQEEVYTLNKQKRRIIEVEKNRGLLYIPKELSPDLPIYGEQVKVLLEGNELHFRYNFCYNRLEGLSESYRDTNIDEGDFLMLAIDDGVLLVDKYIETENQIQVEDVNDTLDISGLSNSAKGNIAEDRVKEYILLYSQGLLNVYKPVIDEDGVDLIALQSGIFHPVYLQIKSRYNVDEDEQMTLFISGSTFRAHHSFYLVAVSFNRQTLEIDDKILFIPTDIVEEKAIRLPNGNLRLVASLKNDDQNEWTPYIVSKAQLAEKIIETISNMNRYYR